MAKKLLCMIPAEGKTLDEVQKIALEALREHLKPKEEWDVTFVQNYKRKEIKK